MKRCKNIYQAIFFILTLSNNLYGLEVGEIWYHPNAHWHFVQEKLPLDKTAFPYRDFTPQFGFQKSYINNVWTNQGWIEWKKANNIQSPIPMRGHAWLGLIEKNKNEFIAHPEYLAEIDGKRVGYGKSNKLCLSNNMVFKLILNDAIIWFNKKENMGNSYSIEPSDGAKQCTCNNCIKAGDFNVRLFAFANRLSDSLSKIIPNAKLNLYAYYQHSKPPPFSLRDNIYIIVCPNGYQSDYPPDYLMYLWSTKANNKLIYEYLGIAQSTGDMPRFNVSEYLYRIQLAHQFGYKGFTSETGSNINMSIILTLMNELYKHPSLSWNTVFDNFINRAFPQSKVPMKRLFSRWHTQWRGETEHLYSLSDLKEADGLVKNEEERKRLSDMKAYVHYIKLFQDWKNNKNDTLKTKELFDYVWRTSNRMIINTEAFFQLHIINYPNYSKIYNKKNYSRNYYSDNQIQEIFLMDVKNSLKGKKYFVNNPPSLREQLSAITPSQIPDSTIFNIKESTAFFLSNKNDITLQVLNLMERPEDKNKIIHLYIYSEDYKKVFSFDISKNQKITIPGYNSYYRCYISDSFVSFLKINGKCVVFYNSGYNYAFNCNYKASTYDNSWRYVSSSDNLLAKQYFFLLKPLP